MTIGPHTWYSCTLQFHIISHEEKPFLRFLRRPSRTIILHIPSSFPFLMSHANAQRNLLPCAAPSPRASPRRHITRILRRKKQFCISFNFLLLCVRFFFQLLACLPALWKYTWGCWNKFSVAVYIRSRSFVLVSPCLTAFAMCPVYKKKARKPISSICVFVLI